MAVFVDGCFWHGCLEHGTRTPKANASYWSEKVRRNRARDADTDRRLREAVWLPLRLWEHQDLAAAAADVASVVTLRRPA